MAVTRGVFVGKLALLITSSIFLRGASTHPPIHGKAAPPQSLPRLTSHHGSDDNLLQHRAPRVTGQDPTSTWRMSPVLQAGVHLFFYPMSLRREGRRCRIFLGGASLPPVVREAPQVAWLPQSPSGHQKIPSPSASVAASETGVSFTLGQRESAWNPGWEGGGSWEPPVPGARPASPGT